MMGRPLTIWLLTGCLLASAASPGPPTDVVAVRAVMFFGHSGVELPDREGSAVRSLSLDPPIYEYRHLKHWHGAEEAESPDRIDVIAAVENTSTNPVANVKVRISIFDKVGEMKLGEAVGVTDIDRGLRTAKWAPRSIASRVIEVGEMAPGARRSVVMRDFDLDGHLTKLSNADRWAYELKARVNVECPKGCDSDDAVETSIEVMPRD